MKYLVLNWKMDRPNTNIETYALELSKINNKEGLKIILAPNFLDIYKFKSFKIDLAVQDVSSHKSGAYTGEIGAHLLKSENVKYSIIGHSERRVFYNESIEGIALKIKALKESGIRPIVCVGDSYEAYLKNAGEAELIKDISYLKETFKNDFRDVKIAYEPVWAIGKSLQFTQEQYNYIHQNIIAISKMTGSKVIYGGSVNSDNIARFLEMDLIEGFLLGGASLSINKIKKISNKILKGAGEHEQ